MARTVELYKAGYYGKLEFFHLIASQTTPSEVSEVYRQIPVDLKRDFESWVEQYELALVEGGVFIGEDEPRVEPSLETISEFRRTIAASPTNDEDSKANDA